MSAPDPSVQRFLAALDHYLRRHPTLPQAKPADVLRYHAIGRLMARYLPRGQSHLLTAVQNGLLARYHCTYSTPFIYALWSFGRRYRRDEIDPAIPWSTYKAKLSGRPDGPPRAKRASGRGRTIKASNGGARRT